MNGNDFYLGNSSSQKVQIARVDQIPNVTQYVHPTTKQCNYSVSVVNNLTSTSTTAALSAAQGRILNQSHNFKTYSALAQIGLTDGEETISEIFDAMSNNSMLSYVVSGSQNQNGVYPSYSGTVVFHKVNHTRSFAIFVHNTSVSFFVGSYQHPTGSDFQWSGWHTAGIMSGTSEPDSNSMLEGSIYFQYE